MTQQNYERVARSLKKALRRGCPVFAIAGVENTLIEVFDEDEDFNAKEFSDTVWEDVDN